jgi:peptidyl-tRNA hydrolase, PTH1 family
MKLITGLGNPEEKYFKTRHNVGFLFLEALREKFLYQKGISATEWKKEDMFNSEICFLKEGTKVLAMLQKPLTYMNRSGEAVAKIVKKYEIGDIPDNFILIHDDLDIPLGRFKIQIGKAPLGHNGVKSVEDRLGVTEFRRLRIGVEARDNKNIPGEDYVLTKFSDDEREIVDEVIQDAIKGILVEILI